VTLDDLGNLVDQSFPENLDYLLDLEDPDNPVNQWLPLYLDGLDFPDNPVTLDDLEDLENRLYLAFPDFPAHPFHLVFLVDLLNLEFPAHLALLVGLVRPRLIEG
jgi:hypothetical protein